MAAAAAAAVTCGSGGGGGGGGGGGAVGAMRGAGVIFGTVDYLYLAADEFSLNICRPFRLVEMGD